MKDNNYQIDPNVIWKDVDGIIYILQPEKEEIYELNETGTLIWRLISKGKSLAQVKSEILSSYEVSPGRTSKDIQEFVNRYVKEKIFILN